MTSHIPPKVHALIWQGYIAHIMHMVSCIGMSFALDMLCVNATYLVSNYHVCEFCNAILLQDIIYVNYAMLSCYKALCM